MGRSLTSRRNSDRARRKRVCRPASLVDATELVRMTKPEVGLIRIEGGEFGQKRRDGWTWLLS